MAIYIIQTALSLPGAAILSLAAGAVFGSIMGTVYANIAATLGATLPFLVTRYLLARCRTEQFGGKLEGINHELETARVQLSALPPAGAAVPVLSDQPGGRPDPDPLRTFFFGTMLGIIPGGFVYVNAGASLATIDSLSGIASPRVLGSFALLGCLP